MDKKNLEEVFIGVKPNLGHLRIFGFPIYFHVSKDKWRNMEATRKKGSFVGYYENSKAFYIYIYIYMVKGRSILAGI